MATAYIMVGIPASGKSTWIKKQKFPKEPVIVSTDAFVEEYAQTIGKTYSEVFEEYMPTAIEKMLDQVADAVANGSDIVWDQTSTTRATRRKKLLRLPDYEKVAVVVPTPPTAELQKRLAARPGKNVPWEVVSDMAQKLEAEPPTLNEGFDAIVHVGYPPRVSLTVKQNDNTDEPFVYIPEIFLHSVGITIDDALEFVLKDDQWILSKKSPSA